jgi:hypothetical protein
MVQDVVRDDSKTGAKPSCHEPCAEFDSVLFQHLVCFFLTSADAPFIPVHGTGFSGTILIKSQIERKSGKGQDGNRNDCLLFDPLAEGEMNHFKTIFGSPIQM